MLKRITVHMGKLIVALWSVALALFLFLVFLWLLASPLDYRMIKPLILAIAVLLMINAIVQGIWSLIDPENAFLFGQRWLFQEAKPSESALVLTRVGGIVLISVGIIGLLILLLWSRAV
ncbi:MAG: hypothetical protein NZ930_03315 [Candidatus Bipolaricaulota bacterium]|nr:hypothetical protein [Candidatus Bipolaricaulota bacterium]MDW8030690.1 hypothetical protein [Candidatus Bipolaricaulota bacterium]